MAMKQNRYNKDEAQRLKFIEERDGHDDMLKFAEQALASYVDRSAIIGPYSTNITHLHDVLKDNGKVVKIVDVKDK